MIQSFVEPIIISSNDNVLFAYHQASKIIVDQLARKLSMSNQFFDDFNCHEIGNLGAGSIGSWIANCDGLIGSKRDIHCFGYGAGLSWGMASLSIDLEKNIIFQL